jgi:hypothetical protein
MRQSSSETGKSAASFLMQALKWDLLQGYVWAMEKSTTKPTSWLSLNRSWSRVSLPDGQGEAQGKGVKQKDGFVQSG